MTAVAAPTHPATVAWRDVLDALVATTGAPAAGSALRHAARSPNRSTGEPIDHHLLAAMLTLTAHEAGHLARLLAGHHDAPARLASWTAEAATAYRTLCAVLDAGVDLDPRPPAPPGTLRWAPGTEHLPEVLPLVPLAEDLARRSPSGLTVASGAPDRLAAGWAGPGLVLLDPTRPAPILATTWAHELAHHLDPTTTAAPGQREAFADTLGPLLLAHEPATLAAAAPLIAQAAPPPPPALPTTWPTPTALAWLGLDLTQSAAAGNRDAPPTG